MSVLGTAGDEIGILIHTFPLGLLSLLVTYDRDQILRSRSTDSFARLGADRFNSISADISACGKR